MIGTRRQKAKFAIRKLLLDGRGELTETARLLLSHLRRYSGAGGTAARFSRLSGTGDLLATGMAIGRQEVYLEICNLLYLDERQRNTVGSEDENG